MYCTRADIETKRLPRPYLLQLCDDENAGESDDTADSLINRRVAEAIEDADNEINAYLSAVYTVPLPEGGTPHIVNTLSATIATYYLYLRRGNAVPESVESAYSHAVAMLKQFATRKITLSVPMATAENGSAQPVAVIATKPKIYSNDYGF